MWRDLLEDHNVGKVTDVKRVQGRGRLKSGYLGKSHGEVKKRTCYGAVA